MEKTSPMYFLSLEVQNIRCFGEHQTLSLADNAGRPARWTLLLGDNGVGKTTLLQCLTWMRTVEEPADKEEQKTTGVRVKPIMDDLEDNTEIEALIRTGYEVKSLVTGKFSTNFRFGDQEKNENAGITSIQVGMTLVKSEGELEDVKPTSDEILSHEMVNLFAYSASRHMAFRNISSNFLRDPVANLFSNSADLYDAEQVLLDLDYKSHKEEDDQAKCLLKKVKQLLADLLPDVHNADAIEILGPTGFTDTDKPSGVRVHTPYGSIPLSALSLGYKTMFAWAVDLALRLFRHNPDSVDPLTESAIVIIDEIDLHLHPKWQRVVRRFLCEHFPNVQFICTAHSPFMTQDAEEDNVVVLQREGDHVVLSKSPHTIRGWRIDQIVTSVLTGVSSARSTAIEKLIQERRDILGDEKKRNKEKKRLGELDDILVSLPTAEDRADQNAMDLIRQVAARIKEEGKE